MKKLKQSLKKYVANPQQSFSLRKMLLSNTLKVHEVQIYSMWMILGYKILKILTNISCDFSI